MARYYNKKVKVIRFDRGDLMLRKVSHKQQKTHPRGN